MTKEEKQVRASKHVDGMRAWSQCALQWLENQGWKGQGWGAFSVCSCRRPQRKGGQFQNRTSRPVPWQRQSSQDGQTQEACPTWASYSQLGCRRQDSWATQGSQMGFCCPWPNGHMVSHLEGECQRRHQVCLLGCYLHLEGSEWHAKVWKG